MHTDKLWKGVLSSGMLFSRNVLRRSLLEGRTAVIPTVSFFKSREKGNLDFPKLSMASLIPRVTSAGSFSFSKSGPETHVEGTLENAPKLVRNKSSIFKMQPKQESLVHIVQAKLEKSGHAVSQKIRDDMQLSGTENFFIKPGRLSAASPAKTFFSARSPRPHCRVAPHVFSRNTPDLAGSRPDIWKSAINTRSVPVLKSGVRDLEGCSAISSQFLPISLGKLGRIRQPEFEENTLPHTFHSSRSGMPPLGEEQRKDISDFGKMSRLAARRATGGVDEIQFPQYPGCSIGIG
ncbi:hypothetical protein JK205_13140 [Gluconobacter cerinus]|uniref:hypothetical protein n=1 Tax=Gluconobacter cerinus TaxID=38307 RepID=UPI001B8BE6AB|nr:hypothetical protein [Gluconobacter cerinus]MBS1019869.1 hypothetical protein [Gluconobacter cerinus]